MGKQRDWNELERIIDNAKPKPVQPVAVDLATDVEVPDEIRKMPTNKIGLEITALQKR